MKQFKTQLVQRVPTKAPPYPPPPWHWRTSVGQSSWSLSSCSKIVSLRHRHNVGNVILRQTLWRPTLPTLYGEGSMPLYRASCGAVNRCCWPGRFKTENYTFNNWSTESLRKVHDSKHHQYIKSLLVCFKNKSQNFSSQKLIPRN